MQEVCQIVPQVTVKGMLNKRDILSLPQQLELKQKRYDSKPFRPMTDLLQIL